MKSTSNKAAINTWDHIEQKRFCTAKGTINKMNRQPAERKKMFASHTLEKGLVSKIQKGKIYTYTYIWNSYNS